LLIRLIFEFGGGEAARGKAVSDILKLAASGPRLEPSKQRFTKRRAASVAKIFNVSLQEG
jgi:hypothetical protein